MTVESLTPESVKDLAEGEEHKTATDNHSGIIITLGGELYGFIKNKKLGYIFESSATYKFKGNLPKRMPDLSFVSHEKWPSYQNTEITAIPDLVVEVVSTNDTVAELYEKISHYQVVGVKVIWIVNPFSQNVEIFRLEDALTPEVLNKHKELVGEGLLAGFKLPVATLFAS
jgi:Uma2 family endonuclease